MIFTSSIFGQSSNAKSTAIKASFSLQSIQAYRENAVSKIADFYRYLEIIADSKSSEPLKLQAEEAALALLKENNPEVVDFTAAIPAKIPLQQLFKKLRGVKSIQFVVKPVPSPTPLQENSWTNVYLLEVSNGEIKSEATISQTVYLEYVVKQFGASSKEVWDMRLGGMQ